MSRGKPPRARTKPFVAAIEGEGAEVVQVELTKSQHIRYVATFAGQVQIFISGGSPSDFRALVTFRADVRRWIRRLMDGQPETVVC